jgi:hypothetical protein
MISYDPNPSSYYSVNERFCKSIENEAHVHGGNCEGFCSSWGYDLEVNYCVNWYSIEARFLKIQKKNGQFYTSQAKQYNCFADIVVKNIEFNESFIFQENWLKRIFMRNDFKKQFEFPIYFSSSMTNFPSMEMKFFDLIERYNCSGFILKDGKLLIQIQGPGEDSFKLVDEFIKLM